GYLIAPLQLRRREDGGCDLCLAEFGLIHLNDFPDLVSAERKVVVPDPRDDDPSEVTSDPIAVPSRAPHAQDALEIDDRDRDSVVRKNSRQFAGRVRDSGDGPSPEDLSNLKRWDEEERLPDAERQERSGHVR